jgi:transposase
LEQMELRLEELEATATEDEPAVEKAAARTQTVQSFQRKRPSCKPFPDHLPRERIVIPAPESCPCCGSKKLSKLGEDVTETLEVVPRQWKWWSRRCARSSRAGRARPHPAAGAVPRHATRLRRPQPAGQKILSASTSGRDLAWRATRRSSALVPRTRERCFGTLWT